MRENENVPGIARVGGAASPRGADAEAAPDKGPRRDVLVVDDVQEICDYFGTLLRRVRGFDVRLVTETESARALALVRERDFDLVVSDFRMQEVNGVEILAASRERNPRGRRVLMTGYAEIPAPVERIREADVDAYVQKPLRNQDLLLLVLDFLSGNAASIDAWRAEARQVEALGLREERGAWPRGPSA